MNKKKIIVYLSIKKEDEILNELKETILRSIYESCIITANDNISESIKGNEKRENEDVEKAYNKNGKTIYFIDFIKQKNQDQLIDFEFDYH